jgi:hypothetical protein
MVVSWAKAEPATSSAAPVNIANVFMLRSLVVAYQNADGAAPFQKTSSMLTNRRSEQDFTAYFTSNGMQGEWPGNR